MRYSIYQPSSRNFAYYEGPGPKGTHAESPRPRGGRSSLGSSPEGAAWPLPASAVRVGEGALPVGRIASVSPALALGDADPVTLGIGAGLLYLLWRAIR